MLGHGMLAAVSKGYQFSGNSLAGWTVSGAAVVDSTVGNPAPSIKVPGGTYAIREFPDIDFANCNIEFDFYIPSGTNPLVNLFFGCNASGAGRYVRLDTRTAYPGSLSISASWTSWSTPATVFNVAVATWARAKIKIVAGSASVYINGVAKQTGIAMTFSGKYIGLHGDASIVTGGYFDNINISS